MSQCCGSKEQESGGLPETKDTNKETNVDNASQHAAKQLFDATAASKQEKGSYSVPRFFMKDIGLRRLATMYFRVLHSRMLQNLGYTRYLELKDRFGNQLLFNHAGDVLHAPSPLIPDARQQLEDIKHMEMREDDVIITGFMKAGNHWVQQIIRALLQNSMGMEYKPNTLTFEVLEYIPLTLMPKPSEPRVFFSHCRFHHLPAEVLSKKVKVVYLARNPKDTYVSFYCHFSKHNPPLHYAGTWDQFFHTMLEFGLYHGDWFDHVLDWEQEMEANPEHPILFLYYEDLNQHPLKNVLKLNEFLGTGRSKEICKSIVEDMQIDSMRAKEKLVSKSLKTWAEDSPGIYRKGEVGDWMNWFTPAQNMLFDAVFEKRMANSKLVFRFT